MRVTSAAVLTALLLALLPGATSAGAAGSAESGAPPQRYDAQALDQVLAGIGRDYAPDSGATVVPGEYLVTLADAASTRALTGPAFQAMRPLGVYGSQQIGRRIAAVRSDPQFATKVVAGLLATPGVLAVEPNIRRRFDAFPNDTSYNEQWAHNLVRTEGAWDISTGGGSAGEGRPLIAVLDSGIDASHPDLSQQVVQQFQVQEGSVVPGTQINDTCGIGHGTAVGGVVGARGNNNLGISGVLWNARIIDIALTDGATVNSSGESIDCTGPSDIDTIAAIEHVTALPEKPLAINLSLGAPGDSCSSAYQAAIDGAIAAGIAVISSAGNAGNGDSSIPGSCNGTISVAAVDSGGGRATYSQFNQYVDIAGPGGDYTGSVCPNTFNELVANFVITTSLTATTEPFGPGCGIYEDPNGHRLQGISGTSFSAPYVAAVVALLRQRAIDTGSSLSVAQAEAAIENTAFDLGSPGRDDEYGWGGLDVNAAMQAVASGTIGNLQPDPDFPVGGGGGVGITGTRVADAANLDATDPIAQAIAVSSGLPNDPADPSDGAPYAVLARVDDFADALAGSAIGLGIGPLLYTSNTGPLDSRTEAELLRVLSFDREQPPFVFIMGGVAAIPDVVDARLSELGINPVRVAGISREATAVEASRVVETLKEGAFFVTRDWVFVAFGRGFPDAVTVGQMASYYGIPILVTNTESPLATPTREEILRLAPAQVFVIGGEAVVGPGVFNEIAALGFATDRLAGGSRVDTALAVADRFLQELSSDGALDRAPTVAVNLRNNFNDVLSATLITGARGGIFFPLEGEDGSVITDNVRNAFCGFGGDLFVVGGRDRITAAAAQEVGAVLAGSAC